MAKDKITLENWLHTIMGILVIALICYILSTAFYGGYKVFYSNSTLILGEIPSLMSMPAKQFVGSFMWLIGILIGIGIMTGYYLSIFETHISEVYRKWKAQK